MNELTPAALALAFVAIGFAATVKGAIGFGLPLIAVPIVANILDARTAVLVLSMPVLLSNGIMVIRGGGTVDDVKRLTLVIVGLIAGTVAGAQLLAHLDVSALSILVGLTALVFVGLNLARLDLTIPAKTRKERYLSVLVGLFSGVMGGSTNLFGPVLASFLHALRLSRRGFVFAITLLFSVGGATQVLSYWQLGLYTGPIVVNSVLAVVPTLLGTYLGLRLQDALPLRVWNALVLVFISASGVNLIVRGLWQG